MGWLDLAKPQSESGFACLYSKQWRHSIFVLTRHTWQMSVPFYWYRAAIRLVPFTCLSVLSSIPAVMSYTKSINLTDKNCLTYFASHEYFMMMYCAECRHVKHDIANHIWIIHWTLLIAYTCIISYILSGAICKNIWWFVSSLLPFGYILLVIWLYYENWNFFYELIFT